ncbi:MAG: SDR family oxidoreductase [Bacteroidota bacterium]
MSKRVLITGANGGFGRLTVETLLKNGHQVVGSVRGLNGKNKEAAEALIGLGAHIVEIDVTQNDSVEAGVAQAIERLGGLDVVINNAGVGVIGFQEHFTPEDFQRLFDVNVFGVQRVNRAAIPTLRAQGDGLLIHISSLLGRMTIPFYGPYNASKWALEAVAENYRAELSGFGIETCLVEPGGFATDFMGSLMKPSDQSRDADYGEMIGAPHQMFESFEGALASNPAQNPQNVADAILSVIQGDKGQRPFRTVVDKMGMGDHLVGYNDMLHQITKGVYSAFHIDGMLEVKS